ncbi:MAG TPA: EAL domain-containing protein [Acidimicrobiales bacterium]|nr:EAL domain-containing protein [Acidimicrobiales bacterium]
MTTTPAPLTIGTLESPAGSSGRLARWGGRIPASLRSPQVLAYAIGPFCLIPLWVLRNLRLIADLPLWVYAFLLLAPIGPSVLSNHVYARRPSPAALQLRAATDALATTVIAYATGWGPELVLVYLVAAQHLVAATGPATWRVSRLWTIVGVSCGQAAIALGLAPSFVRSPMDNGAAAIGLFAFFLVSRMALTISQDRERAWNEVRASEDRFRSLVHSSSDLVVVTNGSGRAIYVTGACERILGITPDELRAVELESLMHPDEVAGVRKVLDAAVLGPEPVGPLEMRVLHADGQWRYVEIVGTNLRDNPAIGGVVLNVRDVTDRRRVEAELAYHATHDALTGLPNRPLFLQRLADSLARHRTSVRQPSVLFLDVDRFKLINDTLGHEVGDEMLMEASRRLLAVVGQRHTVARFGGDEFVVLCEPPDDPVLLAEGLLAAFDAPFTLGDQNYFLTASIGLAAPENVHSMPAELIRDADTAMYRAKELGRGRLEVFDEAARAAAVDRVRTEHLLRGAAERNELRLYYQPVMDLASGKVVAAEALVRWQHPRLGLIGPAQFIDAAEDTGLIVPIGEWVMRTACRQAELWARRGQPIDLAVNVSARQLANEEFFATVRRILEPLRSLPGRAPRITLEITERVLISEPEAVGPRLDELKSLGLELSMDDFGTGYSSLSNLRRFPFDSLKIDRRFVIGVLDREDDGTIVRAIIALAHGLGKTVVAEGVETAEQLQALRDLGCDFAQGFHIGEPQPATVSPTELLLPRHRLSPVLSPTG